MMSMPSLYSRLSYIYIYIYIFFYQHAKIMPVAQLAAVFAEYRGHREIYAHTEQL